MKRGKANNGKVQAVIDQLELLRAYGPLLKPKQAEYFRMRYENDLSYAEIAAAFGISRAAVGESVGQTKRILRNYEAKLGLCAKRRRRIELLSAVADPALRKKLIDLEDGPR